MLSADSMNFYRLSQLITFNFNWDKINLTILSLKASSLSFKVIYPFAYFLSLLFKRVNYNFEVFGCLGRLSLVAMLPRIDYLALELPGWGGCWGFGCIIKGLSPFPWLLFFLSGEFLLSSILVYFFTIFNPLNYSLEFLISSKIEFLWTILAATLLLPKYSFKNLK